MAAGLVAYRRRRVRVPWRERWRATIGLLGPTLREPSVAIATVLVVGTLAWRAFLAVRLPVVDYDGWSYHLVFTDAWLQHDALTLVPFRPWTAGYPAATEMLTTWLAAFTHSDTFTGFTFMADPGRDCRPRLASHDRSVPTGAEPCSPVCCSP